MSIVNPFETGPVQNPVHFIGRREEVESIRRFLRQGKQPPHRLRNILISGEEGTGKSSLLRHIGWLAEKEGYYVISETARAFKNTAYPLVSYLHFFMYELLRKAQADKLFDGIPDFHVYLAALQRLPLTSNQFSGASLLDFPGWYYGFAQSSGVGAGPIASWCHDLRTILELAEKKRGVPGCLFFLDDVDALDPEKDVPILFDTVRSTFDSLEECRVMFVLAGEASLRPLVQRPKGMSSLFFDVPTRPWTKEEVGEYTTRQELLEQKLRVSDERIDDLLEITEANPATLALLCSQMFEACVAHEQESFAATATIIEDVCRYIEGVSDHNVIKQIKDLSTREITELAQVAPYHGWTVEEIARYQTFEPFEAGHQRDVVGKQESLQRVRNLYVQRDILKDEPSVSVEGSSLERAYLRFRAGKLKVNWAEKFRDRVPPYEDWAAQEFQESVKKVSEKANFPLQKWTNWSVSAQDLPESLEKRVTDWVNAVKEGTIEPAFNPRQLRLVEEAPGKFMFRFTNRESFLLDLNSSEHQLGVDIFAIQFFVGNRPELMIQLYRMPGNSSEAIETILTALSPVATLLDLRGLDHWEGRFEFPNLETVLELAEKNSNPALMRECFKACLALGRLNFGKGDVKESQRWFCVAAKMPQELVAPTTLANAHNNYGFVSIATQDWEIAKSELSVALNNFSRNAMLTNRAQTIYNLAYIEIMQGRYSDAELLCQQALEDNNSDTNTGFLWVKLCDVSELPPMNYWDTELAREPRVDAAIYCSLAAIYAHRKKWTAAEQALTEAEQKDKNHYMVLRAWGRYYLRRGRAAEAREFFERALAAFHDLSDKLGEGHLHEHVPVPAAIFDEIDVAQKLENKQ